jgi:DNA end-binding protein Ku
VLSKRERVIALEPYDRGLLGTTLRYPSEVRKAEDYFCDLPDLTLAPDMVTLAGQIIDSKAADFDPKTFRDATRRRCSRTSRPSRQAPFKSASRRLPRRGG